MQSTSYIEYSGVSPGASSSLSLVFKDRSFYSTMGIFSEGSPSPCAARYFAERRKDRFLILQVTTGDHTANFPSSITAVDGNRWPNITSCV